MAPKRRRVVKTTRKVVRETVLVSVIDNGTEEGIDNTQNQISLPDFEPETEELQVPREAFMGAGETVDQLNVGATPVTTATPAPTPRRVSTRRTIIIEDKTPSTRRRIPVEEPAAAPKEAVPLRTEEQVEVEVEMAVEKKPAPEEQDVKKDQAGEEDRRAEMSSLDETEGEEEMRTPESEETDGEEAAQPISPVEQEAEKKGGGGEKKPRSRSRPREQRRKRKGVEDVGNEEYRRYVFQVLKQVHPGMRISGDAMAVLNGYMNDMFERLAEEAARLSRYTGKLTLTSREIQGAVRLVVPGELGRHAIAEGAKAISNYMSYEVQPS
ncbi:hypothetical protein SAY87_025484 [Trapa incisa]|uniref:Core Histone H2A/H2B/H3 domain-containing protein n=1 Tax=Trapa incisa TaxID=236973 RepID=A0AAN7GBA1_9MYRT|nr:hypothetical protein SAY87_025484 [Trapa incisa]